MQNAETVLGLYLGKSLESRDDTERVTSGSERGCWKSAAGNSLAAYSTARCVLRGLGEGDLAWLPGGGLACVPQVKAYTMRESLLDRRRL